MKITLNKRKKIILGSIFCVVLFVIGFLWAMKPTTLQKYDIHAGFQVYVDGKLQDFSDMKYMDVTPCESFFHRKSDQLEKAQLHDNVGNVVHVHRKDAVWGDLFKNIGWQIPADKEFVGYLNGTRTENLLEYPILPYDSVVFFSGKIDDMNRKLQGRVTDEMIKEVEKKSESCGNETVNKI